jgi:hypothetical protein
VKLFAIIVLAFLAIGTGIDPGDAPKMSRDYARIGANIVSPDLDCAEDEVVAFVETDEPPYSLGCVNIEEVVAS